MAICEPPWYGTVRPVVWEDGGSNPASYPMTHAFGNRTGNQVLRSDGTVNFTVQSSTNRYTAIGGHSISHDDAGISRWTGRGMCSSMTQRTAW